MKILIIEDENSIAEIIKSKLEKENYSVTIKNDGLEGYDEVCKEIYSLVLLDVMLPCMDGFEILKKIKEDKIDIKIIMLTAKTTLSDKLEGLENGADDYITKPFHIEEVIARINIQLNKTKNNTLIYGDIELNVDNSKLYCKNTECSVELVCKEYQILEYLINNKAIIVSKDQIYARVWGYDNESESNNLEAYLSFLRKKLKAIGSNVKIKAIRNIGYKLEVNNE